MNTVIAVHLRTSKLNADRSHGVFHKAASHFYVDAAVEVTGHLDVLKFDVEKWEPSWRRTRAVSPCCYAQ